MKVILQKDVQNLGQVGEVVKVKDGYGRNFLVPRGLAVIADSRNLGRLGHQKRVAEGKAAKERAISLALAETLAHTPVSIKRKAGEEGKLFGAVTNREIAEALQAEGVSVDRRQIILPEPIKNIGVFQVPVKLAREVDSEVKVYVIQE